MATTTSKRPSASSKASSKKTPSDKAATSVVEPADDTVATGDAPKPTLVAVSDPVVGAPDLKKKELIDLVVERSKIKKKDAKPVVEAMLAVLGEAMAAGREMNLQPLGKMRINRSEQKANGRVIICKLRQSNPVAATVKEPLAETQEDL